jgi:hypothetical protein
LLSDAGTAFLRRGFIARCRLLIFTTIKLISSFMQVKTTYECPFAKDFSMVVETVCAVLLLVCIASSCFYDLTTRQLCVDDDAGCAEEGLALSQLERGDCRVEVRPSITPQSAIIVTLLLQMLDIFSIDKDQYTMLPLIILPPLTSSAGIARRKTPPKSHSERLPLAGRWRRHVVTLHFEQGIALFFYVTCCLLSGMGRQLREDHVRL